MSSHVDRWERHLRRMEERQTDSQAAAVVAAVRDVWTRLRAEVPELPVPTAGPLPGGLAFGYEMAWFDKDQRLALHLEVSYWACEWCYREEGATVAGGLWPIVAPVQPELIGACQRLMRRTDHA